MRERACWLAFRRHRSPKQRVLKNDAEALQTFRIRSRDRTGGSQEFLMRYGSGSSRTRSTSTSGPERLPTRRMWARPSDRRLRLSQEERQDHLGHVDHGGQGAAGPGDRIGLQWPRPADGRRGSSRSPSIIRGVWNWRTCGRLCALTVHTETLRTDSAWQSSRARSSRWN